MRILHLATFIFSVSFSSFSNTYVYNFAIGSLQFSEHDQRSAEKSLAKILKCAVADAQVTGVLAYS